MINLVVYLKNGTNHALRTTKNRLQADLETLRTGMSHPAGADENGSLAVFLLKKRNGKALIIRARDIDYIEQFDDDEPSPIRENDPDLDFTKAALVLSVAVRNFLLGEDPERIIASKDEQERRKKALEALALKNDAFERSCEPPHPLADLEKRG